jgi:hypothetical protein
MRRRGALVLAVVLPLSAAGIDLPPFRLPTTEE